MKYTTIAFGMLIFKALFTFYDTSAVCLLWDIFFELMNMYIVQLLLNTLCYVVESFVESKSENIFV